MSGSSANRGTLLTRREFLQRAGASVLGVAALPFWRGLERLFALDAPRPANQEISTLGRVLNNRTTLRDKPSFDSKIIKHYYFDLIIPITGITLGLVPDEYNRVWYVVNDGEGYVYSGGVQPVEVQENRVIDSIGKTGRLAEVTVPYTEAYRSYRSLSSVAYRLYYGTTHWVYSIETGKDGLKMYRVRDDKKGYDYFVNAEHLRVFSVQDLAPISADVPLRLKRIHVNLKDQVVTAYEGQRAVFMSRTATGARFKDGDFRTHAGTFTTNRKRPSRHMAAGEPGVGSGFDLPGVPWVCYLTESGVSLHGTYWHNDFGSPRSHGCINLPTSAARWFYRWSYPIVLPHEQIVERPEDEGTTVVIE